MTAETEQLAAIARGNAEHYGRLAEDSRTAADFETDADLRRYMSANADFFTERADFYLAQAATYQAQGA